VGLAELHDAAMKGDVERVRKLLKKGENPNARDEYGYTPLYWAAINGHVDVVRLLLEHGADPNIKNTYGNTPLHWAALYGYVDVVRLLLEHGADPDARNDYGKTPLHEAADRGHLEVVRLLLQHGADPNVGVGGATPLSFAISYCNADVIKLLLERGASVKPKYLCDAIERECTVAVNALLKRGADVNISCGDDTPLHKAVVKGLKDVVESLLKAGADPNVRDNNYGGTPLHAAASKCSVDVTSDLLRHGADPNARDIFGKTPLHVAAENGCAEVVRLLLEYGADPEIRDNRGDTALQIAKKGAFAVLKNWIEGRGAEKKLSDRAYLVVERGRRLVKKCFAGLPPDVAEDVVVGVSNWLRLNVPGVPRLVKYDGMENCIYVEYVEGRALREVLAERKKLPETCAVVYALRIAEVLQAALERGVVHRDLKPENVVMAKDGVYVLDWEFSARLGEEPRARVGTPRYSPPETRITEKYDVYSLGVMLFEMLTGTANIHVTAFGLRDELAQLIRAMADETPEHRPTMATVRERLKKILSNLSPAEC
jgi:ankyrin repeat protein